LNGYDELGQRESKASDRFIDCLENLIFFD